MSFGKRGPKSSAEGVSSYRAPVRAGLRMSVANPGGLDLRFILLSLGVVIISAGAAMAASSLVSMFSGHPVRTIPQIIEGRAREEVRAALALEAFPDKHGQALMLSLAEHFPSEHSLLLDRLADSAITGADRDGLAITMDEWLVDFAPQTLPALGRTGAQGFDVALDIAHEGLVYVENAAGGCDLNALQTLVANPRQLIESTAYDTRGYQFNMKATRRLVELAAAGRNLKELDRTLGPEDEQALQITLMSVMNDPQIMRLMRMQMAGAAVQQDMMGKFDVCRLGRNLIGKLKSLPSDTKSRIWAMGTNELARLIRRGPPSAWLSQRGRAQARLGR